MRGEEDDRRRRAPRDEREEDHDQERGEYDRPKSADRGPGGPREAWAAQGMAGPPGTFRPMPEVSLLTLLQVPLSLDLPRSF